MENKLKLLFDYQHFVNNDSLARVIVQAEADCVDGLEDDELSLVSAAGEFNTIQQHRRDGNDRGS